MGRRVWSAFVVPAFCVAGLSAPACTDDTSKPGGSGNVVVVDVDATDQPSQPEYGDAAADSIFARIDGSYGTIPDGFAPFASCAQCACPASTFCFGGGRGHGAFSGSCTGGTGAGGLAIGCQPIPAACATAPSCSCLLGALTPVLPCYSVCSEQNGFVVYCP